MTSSFASLPNDIKKYEIFSRLDGISKLSLRYALLGAFEDPPEDIDYKLKKEIYKYSPKFFDYFSYYTQMMSHHTMCAKYGNIELFDYIKYEGLCYKLYDNAAKHGHLDFIKHLHKCDRNIPKWGANTCAAAAKGGHLDIVIYLRKNGCGYGQSVCHNAVLTHNLAVLFWALDNGFDCYKKDYDYALTHGYGNRSPPGTSSYNL